jgi:hypothetical protein
MTRRMLPVFSIAMLAALAATGCASNPTSQAVLQRVTPGLVNVPWISGSTTTNDQRMPDVVSNGTEACGRDLEHSRLWNQWPPCPTPSAPVAGRQLLPTSDAMASAELVRPWQEVTLFEWPCTPASQVGQRGRPGSSSVVLCK